MANQKKLEDMSLDEVVNKVTGLSAVGADFQVQSIMAVPAKCTQELVKGFEHLTQNLHAQTTFIGQTIRKFDDSLKVSIQQFDASSGKVSRSLARATWALVLATLILVAVTGYQAYQSSQLKAPISAKP